MGRPAHVILFIVLAFAPVAAHADPARDADAAREEELRAAHEAAREAAHEAARFAAPPEDTARGLEELLEGAKENAAKGAARDAAREAARNAAPPPDTLREVRKLLGAGKDNRAGSTRGTPHTPVPEAGMMPAPRTQIMVFLSLSMPDKALAAWLEQAQKAGAAAAVRGFHGGTLRSAMERLSALPGGLAGGLQFAPVLFRRFQVEAVPVVVVLAEPLPPCRSRECAGDPPPAHDRVAGNIGLPDALSIIASEGEAAKDAARLASGVFGGVR